MKRSSWEKGVAEAGYVKKGRRRKRKQRKVSMFVSVGWPWKRPLRVWE